MQNLLNFRPSLKIVSHKHSSTTNWNLQLCDVISVLVKKDTPALKLGGGGGGRVLSIYHVSTGMCGHYRYTFQLS